MLNDNNFIKAVQDYFEFLYRVKSPVDGMAMDGITSVHIPHATDYVGEHRVIRWTDVFFIENKDGGSREPVDVSRMAETLASAACIALTPHLDQLKEADLVKIGLRVSLETDKVLASLESTCVHF